MRKEQHIRTKIDQLEAQADLVTQDLRAEQTLELRRALNMQLDAIENQIDILKWVLKEK